MTPTTLPPRTVQEIVDRAGRPDFDRWTEQLTHCGHCSRPVRLRGHVEHRTVPGGQVAYSTDAEPDRVLLIRCGNRRAAVCPPCSFEYAGDMWQLLYAGAAGGRKGVPESIRSHPLVFATLTAPGFGPVHTTRADRSGGSARCRPTRGTPRLCSHGRPSGCTTIHAEDDPRLGHPICPDCYDYPGHIAFNWHAPELWRRFTIALRRALARTAGLTAAEFTRRCRVSFVKVAEFQRRGVVHFHALIRLDGPGEDYQPPQLSIDAAGLIEAIRQAAGHVRLTVEMPGGPDLVLRFGTRLDTQTVNGDPAGELTPEHAARYIAKYATKSADDFGLGEHRITPEALSLLDVPHH
ncbi:MAG: replication initiator, partial [Stackebrandtia sp.]